jgi:benzylsuccinate CoA-transferase BbsE subunit
MGLAAKVHSTVETKQSGKNAVANTSALSGLRVVDLSGMAGQYCGKMFADLGADVILVEPPGGSKTRREGPFLHDRIHLETSLTFSYFNSGKRSLVLDPDSPAGQAVLHKLIGTADLVLETEKPGVMKARSLDFQTLVRSFPKIIVTSITPFGQTGPYANYESEDIVMLAIGGLLALGGYFDTEPIAAYGNQAYLAAAQFAAVASLMALFANEKKSGEVRGRHIDVSIQECVVLGLENTVQMFDLQKVTRRREAGQQKLAGTGLFSCADGHVYLMASGIASSSFWENTIRWLEEEGVENIHQLREPRWTDYEYLATDEAKSRFENLFKPFASRSTKSYLYTAGQAHRVPICPVNSPKDIVDNRQLNFRGFFSEISHTFSGAPLKVPGAPYHLTKTPWRLSRPSPMLGEHTSEILTELGVEFGSQAALLKAGVVG